MGVGKGLTNYERNNYLGDRSWGVPIALGEISGLTAVDVCGYDAAAAASTDIWDGSAAFPNNSANAAMEIISSVTSDRSAGTGARTAIVYGVQLDASSNWDYVNETVTLTGNTAVALANEYLYVYKVVVATAGTGLTNAGTLTVRLASAGATQCVVTAGFGESKSAVFPVASGYQALIDKAYVDFPYAASALGGVFAIALRTGTGPWLFKMLITGSSATGRTTYACDSPLVVPEKSLIKMRTVSISAGGIVSAGFSLVLCDTTASI